MCIYSQGLILPVMYFIIIKHFRFIFLNIKTKARIYVTCINNIFSDLYIIAEVFKIKKMMYILMKRSGLPFSNDDDDICTRALIVALINLIMLLWRVKRLTNYLIDDHRFLMNYS